MTIEQLTEQFNILKNDVSSLPDTTSYTRITREEGNYSLSPKSTPKTEEERATRILGAIKPLFGHSSLRSFHSRMNDRTQSVSESYLEAEKEYLKELELCVTNNRHLKLILLLLRWEGIINFGVSPMCDSEDPVQFLRGLIHESGLQYSDTLMMLLDHCEKSEDNLFIQSDNETPAEKLNKAFMLLSLLSPEEIRQYGSPKTTMGAYSNSYLSYLFLMDDDVNMVLPFAYLNRKIALSLFSDERIIVPSADGAKKLVNALHEKLGFFASNEGPMAVNDAM